MSGSAKRQSAKDSSAVSWNSHTAPAQLNAAASARKAQISRTNEIFLSHTIHLKNLTSVELSLKYLTGENDQDGKERTNSGESRGSAVPPRRQGCIISWVKNKMTKWTRRRSESECGSKWERVFVVLQSRSSLVPSHLKQEG